MRAPVIIKQLFLLGVLSELLYLGFFLRPFPLLRYYATPLLDLGKLTDHTFAWGLLYLAAATFLFLIYGRALQVAMTSHDRRLLGVIVLFALIFASTLFFVYPWGAADIYDYILNGKILTHYHANPFVVRGIDLPDEPWLPYAPWSDTAVAYGPLWVVLAGLMSRLAGHHLLANLLVFKAGVVLFYWLAIACVGLMWSVLDRNRLAAGVLLFAWNPLVLLETIANGHNDVMMVAFILFALYLFSRQRRAGAQASLAASSLVKFTSAALAPLFLMAGLEGHTDVRDRARYIAISLGAFLLPTLLIWLPFWQGADPLALGRRAQMFTTSLPALVKVTLQGYIGPIRAMAIAQGAATGLFVTFVIYQMIQVRGSAHSLIESGYETLFFYLAIICPWLQPWYLIWLVGLGALCLEPQRIQRTWLFSYLGLWNYFVFSFLWFWAGWHIKPLETFQVLAMLVIVGPPLALWLLQIKQRQGSSSP